MVVGMLNNNMTKYYKTMIYGLGNSPYLVRSDDSGLSYFSHINKQWNNLHRTDLDKHFTELTEQQAKEQFPEAFK